MLRRGFKSQSERQAVEFRKTLGLIPIAALSAHNLAAHLGVTVWSAREIRELPEKDRAHLLGTGSDEWSAFVIREGDEHLIVHNPTMSVPRINSVVMHELAHIILGHKLAEAQQTVDGHFLNGAYDKNQEEEADWLGGALLLPRPALLWMRSKGMSDGAAVEHFGVSQQMLTWRIRMTGVDYQLGAR